MLALLIPNTTAIRPITYTNSLRKAMLIGLSHVTILIQLAIYDYSLCNRNKILYIIKAAVTVKNKYVRADTTS